MLKLTIDGKEIEVPQGTRLIEAVKMQDEDVPYYCYHPGLSIAGNCRMCLVEVEKMPKLVISCHTQCQEGMVVHTKSERVLTTRKHILEFLLVNHPLDCPVCDQAGECWLQDYYMRHGVYDSRVNENKVKKRKAVSLGPTVMLDAERCVLCSRCVRFCDEISGTSELGIAHRGDHCEITVFPGSELNNPYSGNVVDICPVGALTDKDFRFKIRVWYLESADSVCGGCSRGCNISVQYNLDRPHHGKGDRVKRLKPRYHEQVNKWWMCDEGRYGYKYHDHGRIAEPFKREKGRSETLSWDEALDQAAQLLKSAAGGYGVFVSPQLSNESLFLIGKLLNDSAKTGNVFLLPPHAEGYQDDILIRADKHPNTRGAEILGFRQDPAGLDRFLEDCEKGRIRGIVVFGQDLASRLSGERIRKALEQLEWILFIGPNVNGFLDEATLVLPSATHFEEEGTFTNFEGRTQKFNKVLEPLAEARPVRDIMGALAGRLGAAWDITDAEGVFGEMAARVEAFRGVNFENLNCGCHDVRTMAAPTAPVLEQSAGMIFNETAVKPPRKDGKC